MKLPKKRPIGPQLDARKISSSIVILSVAELLLLLIVVAQSVLGEQDYFSLYRLPAILALSVMIVFDVGSAVYTARALRYWRNNVQSVETSLAMVEELNGTLRAQRHDFLNHLQVVSGLIQMEEFQDASDYIRRISGDIADVSRVLRTKNPAVNALLQAKTAMCRQKNVAFDAVIRTDLAQMPLEDWQMCRILSNLIDNAVEAMTAARVSAPVLRLILSEDEAFLRFSVENNGPEIPAALAQTIFFPGVSTKGEGRGMGLSIVRQVLRENGGNITVSRNGYWTVFEGQISKAAGLLT